MLSCLAGQVLLTQGFLWTLAHHADTPRLGECDDLQKGLKSAYMQERIMLCA